MRDVDRAVPAAIPPGPALRRRKRHATTTADHCALSARLPDARADCRDTPDAASPATRSVILAAEAARAAAANTQRLTSHLRNTLPGGTATVLHRSAAAGGCLRACPASVAVARGWHRATDRPHD